jgi:hypothetical protein
MQTKTARHSVGTIFFFFVLALLPHFIGPDPAMAFGSYLTAFNNLYRPGGVGSSSGTNASCALCHATTGGGDDLNAYGEAFAAQPHGTAATNQTAFRAIEGANSDNDPTGASNLAEITASTQPGWTPGPNNTLYDVVNFGTGTVTFTNQNPPTLPGSLDPVAANRPPVANAGPDQAVTVGATVTLDGSQSSDPDSNPLTYAWSFVLPLPAGSAATLAGATTVRPTFVADVAGTFTVQLIVNDGQVNSPPDTVVVSTQNLPPVANAGPDQAVTVGATVTLDGRASSDPEGRALTYRWVLVSQPAQSRVILTNPTTAILAFVADAPGDFVVGLVVNDGVSNSTQTNVVVTVQNAPASDTSNSNCFIATAAFGSPLAPQVQLLREVRDAYLLPHGPGRVLVDWYYAVSPGVAGVISRSETLRAVVRVALMPLLGWATLALWSPALGFGVPLLPIVGVWLVVRRSRRG